MGGTASQRLFCFVVVITEALHLFTQRSRLHQAGVEASAVCGLCVSVQNTELLWRNSVRVCVMCAVCQRSSSYSGGVPPSDGLCVFSAHLPYFVHLFMYLLALRVSRCFM